MSNHPFEKLYRKYNGIDIKTASIEVQEEYRKDIAHLVDTVPTEEFIKYDFQETADRINSEQVGDRK